MSLPTLLGRNKDLYGGMSAFTLDEAQRLLPSDTLFNTNGGYLFSDRPTREKPYGEPAIIVTTDASTYDPEMEQELFDLAFGLNHQHRFVLEAPGAPKYLKLTANSRNSWYGICTIDVTYENHRTITYVLLPGQPSVGHRQVDDYRGDLIVGESLPPFMPCPHCKACYNVNVMSHISKYSERTWRRIRCNS